MAAQPRLKPRSSGIELLPSAEHGAHRAKSPYRHLLLMGLLHLPIMYAIMFTMVYSLGEVVHNLNTFYMAGMMAAPMIVLMPMLMSSMYQNRKINLAVYTSAAVIFIALFAFMRNQTFIGDKQFLRSMIPHHSGAVLMCERAKLSDPEVINLCQNIIKSQQQEIDQMRQILDKMRGS